jgi:hypothetical protein
LETSTSGVLPIMSSTLACLVAGMGTEVRVVILMVLSLQPPEAVGHSD